VAITLKIPLPELLGKYEALGPLEELDGERTFVGRCATFESFLDYGAKISMMIAADRHLAASSNPDDWPAASAAALEQMERQHPGLFALIQEAWPAT
jgi:hypothetical protein